MDKLYKISRIDYLDGDSSMLERKLCHVEVFFVIWLKRTHPFRPNNLSIKPLHTDVNANLHLSMTDVLDYYSIFQVSPSLT